MPSNNITFSIIVPIYNVEKYLSQCVNSVIGQDCQSYELILVDDGSPDGCPQKCEEFAKNNQKIRVIHKKNGGLVSARKAGAEVAQGDYVICLDGDDWLETNCLSVYTETIKRYNPDIICSSYISSNGVNSHTRALPYKAGLYDKNSIERDIYPILIQSADARYFRPQLWAKCIKKELYLSEQLAVDDRIVLGEDGSCTIPCIYHANSLYIETRPTYNYRVSGDSITSSKKAFRWNGPRLIHLHLSSRIDMTKFDFQDQLYRKTAHELFSVISSQFYAEKPYREIKREILDNMNDEIYSIAIKRCRFHGSVKPVVMQVLLKYRLIFAIKILKSINLV